MAEVLELRDVSVALGGRRVLEDVTFSVGEGQFTGLIGSNGAGKTTLLRAILGLQHASSGSISLHGSIGYVPQKVLLDPDIPLRARDLVGLGLDGQRFGFPGFPSRTRAAAVTRMLEAVDATDFADERVGNLSGGEQQRVLIAHALISRPRLLLLDEPLANLDLRSSQEVISLMGRVAAEQKVAVLLSSHDINALLPEMDRVVYLAGGRAVSGTVDEVIRAEVLSRLYRHHVDVLRVHGRILVVAGDDIADIETPGHDVAVSAH